MSAVICKCDKCGKEGPVDKFRSPQYEEGVDYCEECWFQNDIEILERKVKDAQEFIDKKIKDFLNPTKEGLETKKAQYEEWKKTQILSTAPLTEVVSVDQVGTPITKSFLTNG